MKLAYTYAEAGEAVGYGETTIKEAVRKNELQPSYANSKPVIPHTELERWLHSLPHEPRR